MWFIEFSTEASDIVHEAHPTDEVMDIMHEIMFPNYRMTPKDTNN